MSQHRGWRNLMKGEVEWRIVCSNECRDHIWRKPTAASAAKAAIRLNETYEQLKGLRAKQGCVPWRVEFREIGEWGGPKGQA